MWETIGTGLATKLVATSFSHVKRWWGQRRMRNCPHVVIEERGPGVFVQLSTTPVSLYYARCWQCGGIAPSAAFEHEMQSLGVQVARKTGFKWERVS